MALHALASYVLSLIYVYWIGLLYFVRELFWSSASEENLFWKFSDAETNLMNKRVAMVTGGSGKIGLELCKLLLIQNFRVIVVCKTDDEKRTSAEFLKQNTACASLITVVAADLSSLKSVDDLVKFVQERFSKLNLLVNNAGIMLAPFKVTADGLESHMAVNFVAPAKLSLDLIPLLLKANEEDRFARIINVSSATLFAGKLDVRNMLEVEPKNHQFFSCHAAYANSKLALALFTRALACYSEVVKAESFTCASIHPGVIPSALYRHVHNPMRFLICSFPGPYVSRTAKAGALDILNVCLSKNIKTGSYYEHGCEVALPKSYCDETLLIDLFYTVKKKLHQF